MNFRGQDNVPFQIPKSNGDIDKYISMSLDLKNTTVPASPPYSQKVFLFNKENNFDYKKNQENYTNYHSYFPQQNTLIQINLYFSSDTIIHCEEDDKFSLYIILANKSLTSGIQIHQEPILVNEVVKGTIQYNVGFSWILNSIPNFFDELKSSNINKLGLLLVNTSTDKDVKIISGTLHVVITYKPDYT